MTNVIIPSYNQQKKNKIIIFIFLQKLQFLITIKIVYVYYWNIKIF